MNEVQRIINCQNGHTESYYQLVKDYEVPLYRFCYHLTGNEHSAKDLFQETWLKVIKKINLYQSKYSFKNWLFTIASNTYKDQYRRWKKLEKLRVETNQSSEEILLNRWDEKDNVEDQVLSHELDTTLRLEVNKLKVHYKMVVVLHYFEGLSQKEIAQILTIPEGTVKSRLNQSRQILRKAMEVKDIYGRAQNR